LHNLRIDRDFLAAGVDQGDERDHNPLLGAPSFCASVMWVTCLSGIFGQ
jgi:hypothetical protein